MNTIYAVLALALLSVTKAPGCDCVAPPVSDAFRRAKTVYIATVLNTSKNKIDAIIDEISLVSLEVEKIYKGKDEDHSLIVTSAYEASCGFSFKKGAKYLIYAGSFMGSEKLLATSSCSRTKLIDFDSSSDIEEELKILFSLAAKQKTSAEQIVAPNR